MASSGSTTLPHRSVANIKSPGGPGHGSGPSTPLRPIPSNFGSPSSLRAEEDLIVVEFGTRKLHVGFAGDAVPRGSIWFGPEQQRRVGDFRAWQTDYPNDWRKRAGASGSQWGRDHELWQSDVRQVDLGLVSDKIERALREAYTKYVWLHLTPRPDGDTATLLTPPDFRYLLIDSRPRRMVCVLPSGLPIPQLSAVLDTVFAKFQSPTVSLLSSPVALVVGAGARSALVIDMGWNETAVTSVYEYREVHCKRSVRGGRLLTEETHKLIAKHLTQAQPSPAQGNEKAEYLLSFEECDEIASRLVWCKSSQHSSDEPGDGLPTVQEQDESDGRAHLHSGSTEVATVSLRSSFPPTSLQIPFEQFTEPCENAFFDSQLDQASFDDHELPLHLLVYRSLLQLPLDVRAVCMSRIIFTGGCSSVLGLRGRIFDEVSHILRERGWDPVYGKAAEQVRAKQNSKKRVSRQAGGGSSTTGFQSDGGGEQDGVWHDAANSVPEIDPIEEQLKRGVDKRPRVQGEMKAIESLGAWSGASLISQLKAPAIATIDRDIWLHQGAAGATKASEVDPKTQRQSLGAGGLIRGTASGSSWTLGVWGAS